LLFLCGHQSSLLVSNYAWVLATSPYRQSSLLLFVYAQFAYVASCSCHSLHLLFCQNFLFLFISPKLYVVVCLCAICLCCFVVIIHYAFSFAKILYCCLFVHDLLTLICSCCSHYTFSLFVVLLLKNCLGCCVMCLCRCFYAITCAWPSWICCFTFLHYFFGEHHSRDFFYNNSNNQNILLWF
jgi:hypothetical protein